MADEEPQQVPKSVGVGAIIAYIQAVLFAMLSLLFMSLEVLVGIGVLVTSESWWLTILRLVIYAGAAVLAFWSGRGLWRYSTKACFNIITAQILLLGVALFFLFEASTFLYNFAQFTGFGSQPILSAKEAADQAAMLQARGWEAVENFLTIALPIALAFFAAPVLLLLPAAQRLFEPQPQVDPTP
jgi:hypothetical protein